MVYFVVKNQLVSKCYTVLWAGSYEYDNGPWDFIKGGDLLD